MRENRSIGWDIAAGVFAGSTATWVMGRVTSSMYEHESPEARRRYQEVTGGKSVPDRSAEKVESALGLELSEERHQALAQANHWMVGLAAGAAYALARRRVARADWGQGVLFGLVFWMTFDELFTVATGVARPPQDYPWQAHARGLVGHIAFGIVADSTLDILDRVA